MAKLQQKHWPPQGTPQGPPQGPPHGSTQGKAQGTLKQKCSNSCAKVKHIGKQKEISVNDYALKNHMVTAGSIVNGLRDACNNLKHPDGYDSFSVLLDKWAMGCYELVGAVTSYAPQIEKLRLMNCASDNFEPIGGIFDYDVSEKFGQWFGTHILQNAEGRPSDAKCENKIKELVRLWATGTETPTYNALTEQEIVDAGERVARRLAEFAGFHYEGTGPMHNSPSSRAQMHWRQACVVFDALNGTDLENAVQNLE